MSRLNSQGFRRVETMYFEDEDRRRTWERFDAVFLRAESSTDIFESILDFPFDDEDRIHWAYRAVCRAQRTNHRPHRLREIYTALFSIAVSAVLQGERARRPEWDEKIESLFDFANDAADWLAFAPGLTPAHGHEFRDMIKRAQQHHASADWNYQALMVVAGRMGEIDDQNSRPECANLAPPRAAGAPIAGADTIHADACTCVVEPAFVTEHFGVSLPGAKSHKKRHGELCLVAILGKGKWRVRPGDAHEQAIHSRLQLETRGRASFEGGKLRFKSDAKQLQRMH